MKIHIIWGPESTAAALCILPIIPLVPGYPCSVPGYPGLSLLVPSHPQDVPGKSYPPPCLVWSFPCPSFSSLILVQRWKKVRACKQCSYKFIHRLGNICDKFYAVLLLKWVMLRYRAFWGDNYGFYLVNLILWLEKEEEK